MAHRGQLSVLNQDQQPVPVAYHSHSLSHSSLTPVSKMAPPHRTASTDSAAEGIRKRVCKACDRCRLKKSKCDGSNPCTRCKSDNAVCVFGERKKSHDKVYPKGYVEMLEQQQTQLVSGLVLLYEKLQNAGAWEGPSLDVNNEGKPYTHYILQALDLLETKADGSTEDFEDDPVKLQDKLFADARHSSHHHRTHSFSSESEHSQLGHGRKHSHGTPVISQRTPTFRQDFTMAAKSAPSSPPPHHVAGRSNRNSFQVLPLTDVPGASPRADDTTMFEATCQSSWPNYNPDHDSKMAMQAVRSDYAIQAPTLQQPIAMANFGQWDPTTYTNQDMDQEPFGTTWQEIAAHNPYYHGGGMRQGGGVDYSSAMDDFDMLNFVPIPT